MPTLTLPAGAVLNYGVAGAGETLILVHGSPGSGRAWARVAELLPSRFHILTPDLPGYGKSDPVPAIPEAQTSAMAAAIGALIAAQPSPVWLCAHSFGANVALHAALVEREHLAGLILLEPVFMRGLALAGDHATLGRLRDFFITYAARVDAGEPDAVGAMIDLWCGVGAYARLPPPVQAFLNGAAAKNVADVRASFAEALNAAEIATLDCPIVIAHGGASPPGAPAIAAALATLLPRAERAEIEGAAHDMLDSHPGPVARLIDRFCRS
jgi:pimeloyl-ACP methyl ester carboxylesterase